MSRTFRSLPTAARWAAQVAQPLRRHRQAQRAALRCQAVEEAEQVLEVRDVGLGLKGLEGRDAALGLPLRTLGHSPPIAGLRNSQAQLCAHGERVCRQKYPYTDACMWYEGSSAAHVSAFNPCNQPTD